MLISRRSTIMLLAGLPAAAAVTPAFAAAPETFQKMGYAINAIDPVAYFTDQMPVPGSMSHVVAWRGAKWVFANEQNLRTFEANPQAYAPRFGGYCAFAASKGYLADTVPEAWTVYEDRLYLNANLRARELWLQDIPGNIAKGEENWPGILG